MMKLTRTRVGDFRLDDTLTLNQISAPVSYTHLKKMFSNMCTYYKVPIHFFSDKESVGHAIGKEFRASLAVLDEGFAKTIEKYFEQGLE